MYKHIIKIIMQIIEEYIIQKNYLHKQEIDNLWFFGKIQNVHNYANYANLCIYQNFIEKNKHLDLNFLDKESKYSLAQLALSNQVTKKFLLNLYLNLLKFIKAIKICRENQAEFLRIEELLKYRHKEESKNLLDMAQIMSKSKMKTELINLSPIDICVPTVADYSYLHQASILPNIDYYVVEVVYDKEELDYDLKPGEIAAINVDQHNLEALTANEVRFVQGVIKEKIRKSINRYYNEQKAKLTYLLPTRKQTSKLLMLMVV